MESRRMQAMVLASLLVAGCGSDGAGKPATSSKPMQAAVTRPETVRSGALSLPSAFRLPGVESVREADSWSARLATLTNAERARLEAINARYFGMLAFASAEQQQSLVKAGFPMPEEWLAADAMRDEELARLAKARSPKGAMFYADRQLDRYIEARQRMADKGGVRDVDRSLMHPKVDAMLYAGEALALSRSPFAAYMYGSINAQLFDDPAYTAAAISVAWALGDVRGQVLSRQFAESMRIAGEGKPDLGNMMAAERLMWRHVHRYRPL